MVHGLFVAGRVFSCPRVCLLFTHFNHTSLSHHFLIGMLITVLGMLDFIFQKIIIANSTHTQHVTQVLINIWWSELTVYYMLSLSCRNKINSPQLQRLFGSILMFFHCQCWYFFITQTTFAVILHLPTLLTLGLYYNGMFLSVMATAGISNF